MSSTLVQSADVLRYSNVGVVLMGHQYMIYIEGTRSRKMLAIDNSVNPSPGIGEFVVVTEIVADTKPETPNEGMYFCKCRRLAPNEVTPQIFGFRGNLRLNQDQWTGKYGIKTFAKLAGFKGEGDSLMAKVELSYLLWHRNPEMPWVGGEAKGTCIEGRYLPLTLKKWGRVTEKPKYYLWRNYRNDSHRHPFFLSSAGTKQSLGDKLWDWDVIQVPVQADKEVLAQAWEML